MNISWEDFEKLKMHVGSIIDVQDSPKARKPAYQLKIDFGAFGIKNSSAQITEHYSKEELLGKQVIGVLNFPPKQIANFISECLVLGIYHQDGGVILLVPDKKTKNGDAVG